MEKYSALPLEVRRIHEVETEVVLIILGALGVVPKRLGGFIKGLGIPDVLG